MKAKQHSRKVKSLWLCQAVFIWFMLLVNTSNTIAQSNQDFTVSIYPRGSGWDVKVSWHVQTINIQPVKYKGSITSLTASYPQPYISNYVFHISNEACGGVIDLVTGLYPFPDSGFANITVHFPAGMFPGVGDFEITSTSTCGQDGSVNLLPQPVITFNDVSEIAGSIWDRIELPELAIRANPTTGLVTVPEWFWLEQTGLKEWWPGTDPGQGGQPFGVTVTIPLPGQNQTVTVLADAVNANWNFDDKGLKALKSSTLVGKPYPKKSNVQHAYNSAETFKPTVLLRYVPRYAWNGGSWTQLPDLFRESLFTGQVRIKEAQTILIAPDRFNFGQ